jgi:hypothetical protein
MSRDGKGHLFKLCPYSTQSTSHGDTRIPEIEKTDHTMYDGRMTTSIRGNKVGYRCNDPSCSYYTGFAVTEITKVRYNACSGTLITGVISIAPGTFFLEV